MSKKLVFFYDELMTKEGQEKLRLPIKFLSYGYTYGRMYWCSDGKKRRYFIVPPQTIRHRVNYNRIIYGGIFVINDFKEYERAIYSYYNSSIPYTECIMQEDLFFPTQQQATPIKFKSIEDFELCKFSSLNPIDSLVMMGNEANHKITNSMSKGRYYRRTSGIDVPNFLLMIKENNSG